MKIHTQNVVEKLVPGLFIKNHNWADLWTNSLTFYTVCLCFMSSWGHSKFYETAVDHLILPHIKLSSKAKRGLELVFPASFSAWFLKKNVSHAMFY